MEEIRQYLFSVIVSAVVCGLIYNLLKTLHIKQIGTLLCGIILTIAVIGPINNINEIDISQWLSDYSAEAKEVVAYGQHISHCAQADIIKLETEAYILDKAVQLGADISVAVTVADTGDPIPASAEIHGSMSPYIRLRLEKILEEDLGITKENQQWNG